MKRILLISLLLLLLIVPVMADDSHSNDKWNIYAGSGVYVSHIGVGRDFGRMEVGANINTGFPNLFIVGAANIIKDDTVENKGEAMLEALVESFTLAYSADVYFKYDVLKSERTDLDLSMGIAGIYCDNFINTSLFSAFLEFGAKFTYNFKNGNGLYIETNLPLLHAISSKDTETGKWNTPVVGTIFTAEGIGSALLISGLFCTRIGYAVRF